MAQCIEQDWSNAMTDSIHVASNEMNESLVHAPHRLLTDYYADEPGRDRFIANSFDAGAQDYDRIERVLGLGSGSRYRRRALIRVGVKPGLDVLDVGMGTGLVSREIVGLTGEPERLMGVDPSIAMMAQADLPSAVRRLVGRAEKLPLPDASVDMVTMGYALRHVADMAGAFREFARVLRPGGKLLILEITKPAGRLANTLLKAYMRGAVPAIARLVARRPQASRQLWRYYWDTIEACAPPAAVLETLVASGFGATECFVELGIFSQYCAVRAPRSGL
jgi:demethylmenaquinone methyltransferase/2-methoxy-6-polyprenyl-1,4-benzoquinol methylase